MYRLGDGWGIIRFGGGLNINILCERVGLCRMFNSLNTIFLATTKKNSRAFEVLLKINDIKTKQMRERFDQNIHRLRRVYEAEAAEVLASHARISSEMKNEIIIFEEHNEAEANFSVSLGVFYVGDGVFEWLIQAFFIFLSQSDVHRSLCSEQRERMNTTQV